MSSLAVRQLQAGAVGASVDANLNVNKLIDQISSALNQPDRSSFVQDKLNKVASAANGYSVLVGASMTLSKLIEPLAQ